ncbi:MAG: PEP-CTERM system TPR-repeat protein PrsT [Piscirickettsiaceae bacterium]|nr:MAG: PEP-CTERM system TPR-repeat protein PrsT [Piscirickettsiaceae bacterium]
MDNFFKSIIALLFLAALSACGIGQSDADYLNKAEEYLANSDSKSALIELKNAVKANPKNPQAHVLLGKTYFETKQFGEAAKELSKARSLNVENNVTLPLLAKALVKSNQFSDLEFLPTTGLERRNIAIVLAAKTEALLYKNKLKEAKELINDALLADSSSSYALLVQSKIHMVYGDSNQAALSLKKSLDSNPNNFDAKQLSVDIALQDKDFKGAEALLNDMLKEQPTNFLSRLKRGQARVMLGHYTDAQADLDIVLKASPKNSLANFLQGIAYLKTAKPNLAQSAFELAISSDNIKYPGAEYGLGLIHYQKNNLSQAKEYTKQFLKSAPNAISGLKLLALIDIKQKNYSRAEKTARKIVAQHPEDNDAANILATALIQQGNNDEGVEILSRLADKAPESATNRLKLGIGLMSGGDIKKAQQEFEVAYSINPKLPQTNISLVLSYLKQKEYEKALETAQKYVESNPKDAGPKNLLATVYAAKGDLENAKNTFNTVLKNDPGNRTANEKLAQIAINNKDLTTARSYFKNILTHDKNHLQTLINLAALDAIDKNPADFVAHLNQAIDAHPKAIQPKLVLSRYYLTLKQPEKALLTINKNVTPDTNNPATLLISAMAHLQQSKFEDSIAETSRILRKNPSMAQALLLRAKAFRASDKLESAIKDLNTLVNENPDVLPAHLELASIALQQQDTKAFKKHLAALNKAAPGHPTVLKLQAMDARQSNQPDKVLTVLRTLHDKYPSSQSVNELAFQLFQMKKSSDGEELLNNWLAEHPKDNSVLLNLANYQLDKKQTEKAAKLYERVLNTQDKNILALNNLAWIYKDKYPKKALELALKAQSIAPNAAAVNDTLASVYLANNQGEEAEKAIRKALKPDPKNPSILFHHAQILIELDKNERALTILQNLASLAKEFPEKNEAKQLLATLKK